jgi:hypothetical protein
MDGTPEGREIHGGRRLQLRIAGRAIGTHRRAVWDQSKHYTWLLAALAAALVFLGTRVDLELLPRAIVVMIGCVAGVVIALIAMRIVRREVEVLEDSYGIYDRLAKEMGLEGGSLASPGKPNKSLGKLVRAACGATKIKMETWDWFQFSFLLAAVIYFIGFIGVLVFMIAR